MADSASGSAAGSRTNSTSKSTLSPAVSKGERGEPPPRRSGVQLLASNKAAMPNAVTAGDRNIRFDGNGGDFGNGPPRRAEWGGVG
jgi:hypothetical protein